MVASTKTASSVPGVDFDAAADRIRDLNEQVIEQAKKSGNVSIDAYEKALTSVLDFEKKIAGASQLDFVKALTDAHVNFVSQTSEAYLKAAREVLK